MKHWFLSIALICFGSSILFAQSALPTVPNPLPPTDIQNLETWFLAQQYQAGTASPIVGKVFKETYASTWWDAFSLGQSGINVGKAGALDYVDLGPVMNVATGQVTRYGLAVPIHVGNIWNTLITKLPPKVSDHVVLASIPNVTLAGQLLAPKGLPLNKFTWGKDFNVAVAYRFGGS